MKGLKLELLGLGVILAGIALSLNNFWGCIGGMLGLVLAFVGCTQSENKGG